MKLVFLHTSDIHGYFLPTDYQTKHVYQAPFGLSRVKSLVDQVKDKYGEDHVIVTDSGDCLQGSALAAYTHQLPFAEGLAKYTEAYNQIGYDARALGNHDFNFGLDYLTYYVDNNRAPIINDNLFDAEDNVPAFGREYVIIEKSGIKIGLLGVTTQHIPNWEVPEHIRGLKFLSAFDQVKHYAEILRPQVDVLAVMYHGGFESDPESGVLTEPHTGENEGYRILTEIPEVDVFLTGHQHRRLSLVTHGKAIVQPGYRGEAVGKIELELNEQHKIVSMNASLIDSQDFPSSKVIEDLVAPLEDQTQEWLDQPLAKLSQPAPLDDAMSARLHGAPFVNLLQQMQMWFTGADLSATAVMSETAHGFTKTTVTLRDVLLNYPYANQLCEVKVTGKELREILEYTASFVEKSADGSLHFAERWIKPKPMLYHFDVFYPLNYEIDVSKPVGKRLVFAKLNGKELEDERIYHLAVNNYRASGGGAYPVYKPEKIEKALDKDYVQMFTEFLTKADIKPDPESNFKFY